jgi:putative membrane protein
MGPEHFVGGWWGGMWIFPLMMMTVFLVVVYLIFVRGVARPPWYDSGRDRGRGGGGDDAMEILRRRFASGEINKEQFQEMKKQLEG